MARATLPLSVLVLAAGAALWSAPAEASYQLCNQAQREINVAIGYYDDQTDDKIDNGQWVSEGWWVLKPRQCATPIKGDLRTRYVYYHAQDKEGDDWGGNASFCIKLDSFTIRGNQSCESRGYRSAKFYQVDTGTTATSYTTNIEEKK